MKKTWMNLVIAVALAPLLSFSETVLLKDNFSAALTSENLPDSARWFTTNPKFVKREQVEQGAYALSIGGGDALRGATAYFTSPDSAVSLAEKYKKIRLTAKLTPTSADPGDELNGLRVILGHSGTSRMTEDGVGDVTLSAYMFALNAGQGSTTLRYRDQKKGNTISTIGNYDNMISDKKKFVMKKGITYSLTIEIERMENGNVQLGYSIDGGDAGIKISYIDRNNRLLNFDTVGFGKGAQVGILNVQDVMITAY